MLVLLMMAATGAWAQEQSETIATTDNNIVEGTHFTISISEDSYADGDGMLADGGITVTSKNGETITKVVISCTYGPDCVDDDNTSVSSGTKEITNGGGTITVTGVNASTFTFTCSDDGAQFGQFVVYYTEASEPAPSGTPVAIDWTAASKTGTFSMPGGNVELEPEYYPQATADGAVTAATGVAATTDDALVTVDETKLTGVAKMMYYVSTSTTAPAYDAEGWTDVLPTAANYTEAGNLNVWYYPVGTDEGVGGATATYSDGDICATALTVTLAPAPTYAVTLKEGTDDATSWKGKAGTGEYQDLPLESVAAGTAVTVKYNGALKVKSVKAKKKAAAPAGPKAAAEATAEDKGKLIGTDGNIYADVAAATAAGTTAVAKIIYIGDKGHGTYKHGLALALTDEAESGKMTWQAAIDACSAKNTSTPVTNATWLLASEAQWGYMSGDNGAGGYEALRDGFSGFSGASNLQEESYWSSTEDSSTDARVYLLEDGDWDFDSKNAGYRARACLAF